MKQILKIKRLERNGEKPPMPFYATAGAAGLDLFYFGEKDVTLIPGEIEKLNTGICVEIPQGYVGVLCIRSSLGSKYGITLANSIGIIDSDYRGELSVFLTNTSSVKHTIHCRERFAQLVLLPCMQFELEDCSELSETDRGCGGFGSTNEQCKTILQQKKE